MIAERKCRDGFLLPNGQRRFETNESAPKNASRHRDNGVLRTNASLGRLNFDAACIAADGFDGTIQVVVIGVVIADLGCLV